MYNSKCPPNHTRRLKQLFGKKGPIARLSNDKHVRRLGADTEATIEMLWNKANHNTPWDPNNVKMTRGQVSRFDGLVKTFIRDISGGQGVISSWLKLSKRTVDKLPEGARFVDNLSESIRYRDRHMKENSAEIKIMIEGLYDMMKDKGILETLSIDPSEISKKELWEVQNLEANLLKASKTGLPSLRQAELAKLTGKDGIVGNAGDSNAPLIGKLLRRYQGLLVGLDAKDNIIIPREGTVEEKIVDAWGRFRSRTMKDLLNGAMNVKRLIQYIADGTVRNDLTRAHERIVDAIDALLIQSRVDQKQFTRAYKYKNGIIEFGEGLEVYNPNTKKKEAYLVQDPNDPTKKMPVKFLKKYSPTYVLELTDMITDLAHHARNYKDTQYENKGNLNSGDILARIEEATNPTQLTDRLKTAGESDRYHSLDPIFYLNKYAHDASQFNTSARINLSFAENIGSIIKGIRKANNPNTRVKDIPNVGEYTEQLMNNLFYIRDNAIGESRNQQGIMDKIVRTINAFEYVSKMGLGVKQSAKNKTQSFWDWIVLGSKGLKRSNEFYEGPASRLWDPTDPNDFEMTNTQMVEAELKKYAFTMGDKHIAANLAAATGGSIGTLHIPHGFDIDARGKLVHSMDRNVAQKLLDGTAKISSDIAEYTTKRTWITAGAEAIVKPIPGVEIPEKILQFGSQQWAENGNRVNTFRRHFANAFLLESSSVKRAYHERKLKEIKKAAGIIDPIVTNKELYDRIQRTAGNYANKQVEKWHYNYDQWAKGKYLGTKLGRTQSQFQHFTHAYFDMLFHMMRSGMRDVVGVRWFEKDPIDGKMRVSENIGQMMRYADLHLFLPGLVGTLGFDIGGFWSNTGITPPWADPDSKIPFIGGSKDAFASPFNMWASDEDKKRMKRTSGRAYALIEDPIVSTAARVLDFMTSDYEYDPSLSKRSNEKREELAMEKKYGSFIYQQAVGAAASDILMFGELQDWWDLFPEEYEEKRNYKMDTSSAEWWYNTARIFNIGLARGVFKTAKAFINVDLEGGIRHMFGAYAPKYQQTFGKNVRNWVRDTEAAEFFWGPRKVKPKRISKADQERLSREDIERAKSSLSNF